ncbi:MAG: hypothetical protein MZW92_16275 [Comamonadaceae bacterium]|nr:hypothetical protein [Comamonadaceae bacterium]
MSMTARQEARRPQSPALVGGRHRGRRSACSASSLAPPLVKHFAQQILARRPAPPGDDRGVSSINPYTMSASVHGLRDEGARTAAPTAVRFDELVRQPAGGVPGSRRLRAAARSVSPTPTCACRAQRGRHLQLHRSGGGDPCKQPPSEGTETQFSLNNIRVSGRPHRFRGSAAEGQCMQVTDMTLGVPFLSNLPSQVDIEVQPAFSARDRRHADFAGGRSRRSRSSKRARPRSMSSSVDLDLTQLCRLFAAAAAVQTAQRESSIPSWP